MTIFTDHRARLQRNCRIRLFRYESMMSISLISFKLLLLLSTFDL